MLTTWTRASCNLSLKPRSGWTRSYSTKNDEGLSSIEEFSRRLPRSLQIEKMLSGPGVKSEGKPPTMELTLTPPLHHAPARFNPNDDPLLKKHFLHYQMSPVPTLSLIMVNHSNKTLPEIMEEKSQALFSEDPDGTFQKIKMPSGITKHLKEVDPGMKTDAIVLNTAPGPSRILWGTQMVCAVLESPKTGECWDISWCTTDARQTTPEGMKTFAKMIKSVGLKPVAALQKPKTPLLPPPEAKVPVVSE